MPRPIHPAPSPVRPALRPVSRRGQASASQQSGRFSRSFATALKATVLCGLCAALAGCDLTILSPSGFIAYQQRNLIVVATVLMMIVIVPVIVMTFVFAWRYRASNQDATYDPEWHHSTQLEVGIWTIPLLIIMALGAVTWISTHTLDPYRPLTQIGPKEPVPPGVQPLEVQAVSLDWKWLFIYPEYGVAAVNELAAPVNRPILFRITSSSVWNTLSIPAIAGMIYAMPGMETKLNAVANYEGEYRGLSGHYSGSGFSRMTFAFRSLPPEGFDQWVQQARSVATPLDSAAYLELDHPSEAVPVSFYGSVEDGLFQRIVGMCVAPGQMCVTEMHHLDAMGGIENAEEHRQRLEYDNRHMRGDEPPGATVPASGRPARSDEQPEGMMPRDQERARGGVNQGPAPDAGGSDGETPAPPQLNAPGTEHQH